MGSKRVNIEIEQTLAIPLKEVSGICTFRRADGTAVLAAVGDASSVLAWAKVSEAEGLGEWNHVDLAGAAGSALPRKGTQAEAVAADAAGLLLVLLEEPGRVLVFDIDRRSLVVQIDLVVADGPVAAAWAEDPNSRGEGLILLRDGRLLVVKEKRPAALMEFGPAGSEPKGVDGDQLLPLDGAWTPPAGPTTHFEALATWLLDDDLAAAAGDLSDAALGFDGRLYLLSDQSSVIVRPAPVPPPGGGPVTAEVVVPLPGKPDKAEALALLPDGRALVAPDTKKAKKNLLLLSDLSGCTR